MKQLLQTSAAHRFAFFIAVAIALGITVHQLFLVVAQILAVVACLSLMIGWFRRQRWPSMRAHHQQT